MPQLLVVGADVERHRQARVRIDAGAGGVERELADRNAHAVGAEIAEAEDPLSVGDDDDADVLLRPVAEDAPDAGRDRPGVMKKPFGSRAMCENSRHASPTVGV